MREPVAAVGHTRPRDSLLYGGLFSTSANAERHEIDSNPPTLASDMEVRWPMIARIDADLASLQLNDRWYRLVLARAEILCNGCTLVKEKLCNKCTL
jgi:hypothetical protein